MIEKVSELEEPGGNVYYLLHHAVIHRDAETTKLRIVYEISSKEAKNWTSPNDCLHTGPSLNPLLFDILIRFRENKTVLVEDIEKAFFWNVAVDLEDRDSLRFSTFNSSFRVSWGFTSSEEAYRGYQFTIQW